MTDLKRKGRIIRYFGWFIILVAVLILPININWQVESHHSLMLAMYADIANLLLVVIGVLAATSDS